MHLWEQRHERRSDRAATTEAERSSHHFPGSENETNQSRPLESNFCAGVLACMTDRHSCSTSMLVGGKKKVTGEDALMGDYH